jgi:hypothetical protein
MKPLLPARYTLETRWLSAGFAIWHQHRGMNCGKAGADKQIILQSQGDVKGTTFVWTGERGKRHRSAAGFHYFAIRS